MLDIVGVCAVIVWAISLGTIISVMDTEMSTGRKLMWGTGIVLLPIVGLLAWLLFAPRVTIATV